MCHYHYKCFDCGKKYSSKHIEENLVYLCPVCGKAERNMPLKGVLTIDYDFDRIKKKVSINDFLKFTPGKLWDYPPLWPIKKYPETKTLSLLQLNQKPVIKNTIRGRDFLLFDDTRNPTLSYKDRASMLVTLKALELGVKEISAASTGNAGSSIAGICARLGIKSHIFVPSTIPEAKRMQIQACGANIYLVDGTYDDAFDLCLEISNAKKYYNRNTAYNPLTIEGKKSAAFDMFIQLCGKLPDNIFVPVGDGVILSGLFKGFYDLKKLGWINKYPKLIAVQARGSNALVRYLEKGVFKFINASTIADSICAAAPRNLYMAADSVKKASGFAISVTDKEILTAQKIISYETGILVEPSCSATYAGFKKMTNGISDKESVMLMLTGNGLKDTSALLKWNKSPRIYSAKELRNLFELK